MYWKCIPLLGLAVLSSAVTTLAQPTNEAGLLRAFKRRAAKFDCVITVPQFETTTNGVRFAVRQTIAVGNAALDRIGALKPRQVTFENTVRALDDIGYQISLADDRLSLIKETSTNAAMRDAATEALKQLRGVGGRVGLPRGCLSARSRPTRTRKPKLKGEDAKLLADTMRDYRRAGLDLPKAATRRGRAACARSCPAWRRISSPTSPRPRRP